MSDPVVDLKHELLAAADRLHGGPGSRPGRGDRGAKRVLLLVASLSVAAVAALLFTTPWTDRPNVVENARAALTPPAQTILHVKWTITTTSRRPACTITRGPSELWIDQTPPHRYRAVLRNEIPAVDPPLDLDPDPVVCSRGTTTELGGTIDNVCSAKGCAPTLRFVPPNTLRVMPVSFRPPTDWAAMLRDALAAGQAHSAGKTRLRGRVVERLRLDPPPGCRGCSREPAYAYVDPKSFHPVEMRLPGGGGVRNVIRYLTYEHLPRTVTNRALTDIRAQHPTATKTGYP